MKPLRRRTRQQRLTISHWKWRLARLIQWVLSQHLHVCRRSAFASATTLSRFQCSCGYWPYWYETTSLLTLSLLVPLSTNRPKRTFCLDCNSMIDTKRHFLPKWGCKNYLLHILAAFAESLLWLVRYHPAVRKHRSIRAATVTRSNWRLCRLAA